MAATAPRAGTVTHLHCAHRAEPVAGETACGDWVAHLQPVPGGAHWLAVVDGLGHGPPAAQAAQAARQALQTALADPQWCGRPQALLDAVGPALAGTRGAAMGLACLHQGWLVHAGIGNTRGRLWRAGAMQGLASAYGIVGAPAPGRRAPVLETRLPLQTGDWVLLFSDGLADHQRLEVLPAAWQSDPGRLCDHLMRQWRNPRDDAAVVVAWVASAGTSG